MAALILIIIFFAVLQLNETYFTRITVSNIRFDAVIREMTDGVIVCGPDYRITAINPAASKYLGIAEAVGTDLLEYVLANFSVSASKQELTDSSRPHKQFDIVRRETGVFKPLYLEARLDSLKSLTGEISGIVLTLRDVTETRTDEIMKQDFLSLISHKLRTPVSVVCGNADLLGQEDISGPLSDKQKKIAASILRESFKLTKLLDKLLNFVAAGRLGIYAQKEDIGLAAYLSAFVNPMVGKIKDKKIELGIDCPEKDTSIHINRSSLDIIIENLVENTVKFNDKEIIQIRISAAKTAEGIEIRISDNGPGIPAEEQGKIFGKFYQIEKNFTGNVDGAGLGLALVKRLVDSAGGRVDLRSEIGKGTTFILSFPRAIQ